ncbi:tRNA-splicing endonuclease subunit sen54 [Naganishia albida]|nr:tRNA-splicing endonuclease subunit sen54 [Naganishia albida]
MDESTLATPAKSKNLAPAGSLKRDTPSKTPAPQDAAGDSSDEEDEGPSLETMKALNRQIQRAPQTSSFTPVKIVIPKRGEKDFEPLDETVTIQEKMLRESRQALFDGLSGVRGTSSKNISHTTLSANSPFAQVQLVRGNLFLTLGHTIRAKGKPSAAAAAQDAIPPANTSTMELLPEEALYLLERGTMQIWCAPSAYDPALGRTEQVGYEFDEEVQGFKGMVEMSVMEGFSRFIGQEGLSLERYQVYAGLKRLGYTVQRTERFLPARFRKPESTEQAVTTTGAGASQVLLRLEASVRTGLRTVLRTIAFPFVWLLKAFHNVTARLFQRSGDDGQRLLGKVTATGYGALYEKLRIIPSGHSHPSRIPASPSPTPAADATEDPFASLVENPYLPFFHVWKPATHWTRGKWDRGSPEGLQSLPPDFWIGVVDARSVPFPTLPQMEEIFPVLPALPTPMVRPRGTAPPKAGTTPAPAATPSPSFGRRFLDFFHLGARGKPAAAPPLVNTFLALKQGDRSLIVAVVDGGNVGWTRLGRGGFEEHVMVPNEML